MISSPAPNPALHSPSILTSFFELINSASLLNQCSNSIDYASIQVSNFGR